MAPRLKEKYTKEIASKLQNDLSLKNKMQIPQLQKIVINSGVGKATQQGNLIEGAVKDLTAISGQKAMITRARKSIAGFKLREGQAIGAKVTLRGDQMWEFFDRLVTLSIPRIRDFRGLSPKSFDGRGNYIFPLPPGFCQHRLKFNMMILILLAVWISLYVHPQKQTTKVVHFWQRSVFRSDNHNRARKVREI